MASRELRTTVIAVLLGAVSGTSLVWANSTVPLVSHCSGSTAGGTPLVADPALGTVTESNVGTVHWYNSSVLSSENLRLYNLDFGVFSPSGIIVHPGPNWGFSLVDGSGNLVVAYRATNLGTESWWTNSSLPLRSGEEFSLQASPENMSGEVWTLTEVGVDSMGCPLHGETTMEIP